MLKQVETYLQNKTGDGRLNGLAYMFINYNVGVDATDILRNFVMKIKTDLNIRNTYSPYVVLYLIQGLARLRVLKFD
jgi:hypothetical protein